MGAPGEHDPVDDHEGYVARRYADGSLSDIWSDGVPPGRSTVGFVARCECGWVGTDEPATPDGWARADDAWRQGHLFPLLRSGPARSRSVAPGVIVGDHSPER